MALIPSVSLPTLRIFLSCAKLLLCCNLNCSHIRFCIFLVPLPCIAAHEYPVPPMNAQPYTWIPSVLHPENTFPFPISAPDLPVLQILPFGVIFQPGESVRGLDSEESGCILLEHTRPSAPPKNDILVMFISEQPLRLSLIPLSRALQIYP